MIPEGNPNANLQNQFECRLEAFSDAWLLEVFIALKTSFAWQKFCSASVYSAAVRFGTHLELEALGMGYFFELTFR